MPPADFHRFYRIAALFLPPTSAFCCCYFLFSVALRLLPHLPFLPSALSCPTLGYSSSYFLRRAWMHTKEYTEEQEPLCLIVVINLYDHTLHVRLCLTNNHENWETDHPATSFSDFCCFLSSVSFSHFLLSPALCHLLPSVTSFCFLHFFFLPPAIAFCFVAPPALMWYFAEFCLCSSVCGLMLPTASWKHQYYSIL